MKTDIKKVVLRVIIDGEVCAIKSDMLICDGQPSAVLYWGDEKEVGLRFVRLDPLRLFPSEQSGVDFVSHVPPFALPSDLPHEPSRLGFFRIQDFR
jgi:hypothetical protein